eukprot:237750-Hanusia_phi.AAC.2
MSISHTSLRGNTVKLPLSASDTSSVAILTSCFPASSQLYNHREHRKDVSAPLTCRRSEGRRQGSSPASSESRVSERMIGCWLSARLEVFTSMAVSPHVCVFRPSASLQL